jgi:hypothetical protein
MWIIGNATIVTKNIKLIPPQGPNLLADDIHTYLQNKDKIESYKKKRNSQIYVYTTHTDEIVLYFLKIKIVTVKENSLQITI